MNVFFFTMDMDQAFEEIKWIYGPDENLPYIYPLTTNTVANRLGEQKKKNFS